MDFPNEPLLIYWRAFGDWGFILVIVGVLGEVLAAASETVLEKCKIKDLDKWKSRLKRYEIIAGWILIIGLAMEYKGHKRETSILDSDNVALYLEAKQAGTNSAASYEKAAIAEREAGQAKERAAIIESNNVALSKRVEELRSNNIALEQQMQPRLIESSRPAARLKKFAGTKAVIISAEGGDCPSTANQIGTILQSANWNVSGIRTEKAVPNGVSVGLCSSTNGLRGFSVWEEWAGGLEGKSKLHIACAALVDELNNGSIAASIDKNIYFSTGLRFDGVLIFVGPRPNRLDEQIFKVENELRELDQKMEEVRQSELPFWNSLTNKEIAAKAAPEFEKAEALESQLRNESMALDNKWGDLLKKRGDEMFSSLTPTNRGGTFNLGYEQLP